MANEGQDGCGSACSGASRGAGGSTAHWGNERLVENGKLRWRRLGRKKTRVDVRFGKPLDFSEFRGRDETHELLTEMTTFVMDAITAELRELR